MNDLFRGNRNQGTPYRDITYLLFCLNAFLVIVGYALAVATRQASLPAMQLVKYTLLFISMAELTRKKTIALIRIYRYTRGAHLICLLFLIASLLADQRPETTLRSLTFVIPFLYVLYVTGYLFLEYPSKETLNAFVNLFNLIYAIPVILFFFTTASWSDTDIYHIAAQNINSVFVSNHYGWAGIMVLTTGVDLLRNTNPAGWRVCLLFVSCGSGLLLILISGSRSTWLSLSVVLLVLVFQNTRFRLQTRLFLAAIPFFWAILLARDPQSAISRRYEKTLVQLRLGEHRQKVAQKMFQYFNENPVCYLTGIGGFNSSRISAITGAAAYHNSYLDVLMGAGAFTFLMFLNIMFLRPLKLYLSVLSKYYTCLPALFIIPFFESNLTGGQFLFFPWITLCLAASYLPTFVRINKTAE